MGSSSAGGSLSCGAFQVLNNELKDCVKGFLLNSTWLADWRFLGLTQTLASPCYLRSDTFSARFVP